MKKVAVLPALVHFCTHLHKQKKSISLSSVSCKSIWWAESGAESIRYNAYMLQVYYEQTSVAEKGEKGEGGGGETRDRRKIGIRKMRM